MTSDRNFELRTPERKRIQQKQTSATAIIDVVIFKGIILLVLIIFTFLISFIIHT